MSVNVCLCISLIGAIPIYVPESAEDCVRISESPSETYEKVVRVLEIPELVAGVEIKPSGNLGLQGNGYSSASIFNHHIISDTSSRTVSSMNATLLHPASNMRCNMSCGEILLRIQISFISSDHRQGTSPCRFQSMSFHLCR